jgi:RND superfamily putative drug exporter
LIPIEAGRPFLGLKGVVRMSTTMMKKSRRPLIYSLLVIFLWFGTSGVLGPLFGKLSTVQENDNSAFLPDSAESTQASKIIEKFNRIKIKTFQL